MSKKEDLLSYILEQIKEVENFPTDVIADNGERYLGWLDFLTGKKPKKRATDKDLTKVVDRLMSKISEQVISPASKNSDPSESKGEADSFVPESKTDSLVINLINSQPLKATLKLMKPEFVSKWYTWFSEAKYSEAKAKALSLKRYVKGVTNDDIRNALYITIRKEMKIPVSSYELLRKNIQKHLTRGKVFDALERLQQYDIVTNFLVILAIKEAGKLAAAQSAIPGLTKEYILVLRRGMRMNRTLYASLRFLLVKAKLYLTPIQRKLLLLNVILNLSQ
jgi:hypothetical protein